mgnify:CR=1 FL=1
MERKMKLNKQDEARNYMVFGRIAMGESVRKVGVRYKISGARVHQIFERCADKIREDEVGAPANRFGLTGIQAVRSTVDGWLEAAGKSYTKRTGNKIKFPINN